MKSLKIILGLFILIILTTSATYAQQQFTQTVTAANEYCNSACSLTNISDPFAILIVSPVLVNGRNRNPHPIGVYYVPSPVKKWSIINVDGEAMTEGVKFNVQYYLDPDPNQFVFIVNQQGGTCIDHAALNANPNAQVLFSPTGSPRGAYFNRHEAKIEYDAAARQWCIVNTDNQPVNAQTAFNIVVSSGGTNGRTNPTPTTPTGNAVNNPGATVSSITDTSVIKPNETNPIPTPVPTPVPLPMTNPVTPKSAAPTPNPAPIPIPTPTILSGFVDMHTHPMSHLGFGKKLMHGAPDIGMIIPAGTRNCNPTDFRASTISEALGNGSSTHGGWGLNNVCGDDIRALVLNNFFDKDFLFRVSGNIHGDHRHEFIDSNPPFLYAPHQSSKIHQQMWWEWIKRAKELGNLRVMVALTVNNDLLANIINGDNPKDDKASADLQLDELKLFIGRHSKGPDAWMEIAYTPADLRRIVGENKLAVILGMEVDNIGNFNKPGAVVNQATVKAEIQRLYDKGVRYVFPIHLVNNKFGGTAVYEDLFNFANVYSTGSFFTVSQSNKVDFKLGVQSKLDELRSIFDRIIPRSEHQNYSAIPYGHVNSIGLTSLGKFAVLEMMKLGMMIDIDHMSDRSQADTLDIAERLGNDYPINIGHNGIQNFRSSERIASINTVKRIAALKGVFGVGTADSEEHHYDAQTFISSFSEVWSAMGGDSYGAVAIGTDVNGMERLPRASQNLNSATFYSGFPKSQTGNKIWDYTTDGVAHYGLMADFLRDVQMRSPTVHQNLMNSAEHFARMWEKAERQKTGVK